MIWQRMSLRLRLNAILAGLFGFAMVVAVAALLFAAPEHLEEEEAGVDQLAAQLMQATLPIIQRSPNPEADFQTLLESLRTRSSHLFSFRPAGSTTVDQDMSDEPSRIPNWFVRLLRPEGKVLEIPIVIGDKALGDILFKADMTADISEKWWTLRLMILFAVGLTACCLGIAYLVISRSLRPLGQIETGLSRLRGGDYSVRVSCDGPPELADGCRELNGLASTLEQLTGENAALMRRLVTVQDEERRDISRELHDELGPVLFAIRANTSSLQKSLGIADPSAVRLLAAVEALQQTNRRILEKLRPMHFREIGIVRSLQSLIGGWNTEPARDIVLDVDPGIEEADDSVLLTIYRTIQEGLTNAHRHSRASRIDVAVKRLPGASEDTVVITVSDNGIGMPPGTAFGRGLTGMQERLRALGGGLNIKSAAGQTSVEGVVPLARAI